MKGKALRRAIHTADAIRVNAPVPLITDSTELITPEIAREMLKRNQRNRPINWRSVERMAETIKRGEWQLHAQGIILDADQNIITGQTRLWAIIYSEKPVYLRVSRGTPREAANVIDRGRPQSARDLSSRSTQRRHSPLEASVARCVCVLRGQLRPTADQIASTLTEKNAVIATVCSMAKGVHKSKSSVMVLGAIAERFDDPASAEQATKRLDDLQSALDIALHPLTGTQCWGKGPGFRMALERAQNVLDILENSKKDAN